MKLKCSEPNCDSVLEVEGAVSPKIRVRCRVHDAFVGRNGTYRRRNRPNQMQARQAEELEITTVGASGFEELQPVAD